MLKNENLFPVKIAPKGKKSSPFGIGFPSNWMRMELGKYNVMEVYYVKDKT